MSTASPPVARGQACLAELAPRVERRLAALEQNRVVERLWAGDHTLWKLEPREIPDRLGWLTVVEDMRDEVPALERLRDELVAEGVRCVVLLGTGGSSLAAEALRMAPASAPDAPGLEVLDSTVPEAIRAVEGRIALARAVFVVASKSGTTVETRALLAHFWERAPDGRRFIAITDAGTPLERTAEQRGFRAIFRNRTDIGGRFAALSYFGLAPAALTGVDVARQLRSAREMLSACRPGSPTASNSTAPDTTASNPGAWLGAVLGAAGLSGRDKLTLVLPEPLAALGPWVEQLIAESTGKEGTGILPVEGEAPGTPDVYDDDRLFVAIGDHPALLPLERAGQPVVRLPYEGPRQLGGEFVRWEFATAVAAYLLGIDPFDQPDVQQSKQATLRVLREDRPHAAPALPSLEQLLTHVRPGDYIAIQAYYARSPELDRRLAAVRLTLRDRLHVATTVGYGPRFLHSTGQYHKGGPNNGIFIQVTGDEGEPDIPVPGERYTFRELTDAQALTDLDALRARDRRVAHVTLEELEAAL